MKKVFIVLAVALLLASFAGISAAKNMFDGEPKISGLLFSLDQKDNRVTINAELEYYDVAVDIEKARLSLVILVFQTPKREQFYQILVGRPVGELIKSGECLVEKESDTKGKLYISILISKDIEITEEKYITGAGMAIVDLPGRVSLPKFIDF